MKRSVVAALFFLINISIPQAQEAGTILLPAPAKSGGMPLMEALSARTSSRTFSEQELSLQDLSNLLWAAWGVSRPENGRRTAPSANNRQDIEIYTALPSGVYLYNAQSHSLILHLEKDIRDKTGRQEFVGKAPLNLIYVSDYSKLSGNDEMKIFYSANHTGYISQNVYLYCASAGLNTVVRALVDREMLKAALGLPENKHITLCQTVGYPVD